MTKIEMFTAIASFIPADRTDLTDFIEKEIAQTVKRNSYVSSKPTAKQVANEGYRMEILSTLVKLGKPARISDIIDNTEALLRDKVSTQRVSAILTQLKNVGTVKRLEGKVATFVLASMAEE